MATTEQSTALDRMSELDRAVAAAEATVRERELALARARRAVDRASAELREYRVAVAAGEREPDDSELSRLDAAVKAAEGDVSVRYVDHPRSGPRTEVRHPRHEDELEGAQHALAKATDERDRFAGRHRLALHRELLADTRPAVERLVAAVAELEAADRDYRRRVGEHARLERLGGHTRSGLRRLPPLLDPEALAALQRAAGDVDALLPVSPAVLDRGRPA